MSMSNRYIYGDTVGRKTPQIAPLLTNVALQKINHTHRNPTVIKWNLAKTTECGVVGLSHSSKKMKFGPSWAKN